MTNLNQVFATVSTRSGEVLEFGADDVVMIAPPAQSLYQNLFDAVADLRTLWVERGQSKALKAARAGVHNVVEFLLQGGRFDSSRDQDGLDAGYWLARSCVPYDFVALGVVAQSGPVQDVRPLRYYNQHVDGRAAFVAACEAGLTFTQCRDEEGHDAGFFIARCGDDELMALYERCGGVFRDRELAWLGRVPASKVA